MKFNILISLVLIVLFTSCNQTTKKTEVTEDAPQRFRPSEDLLLVHFDVKTDVDDIHTAAALASLLKSPVYADINFHAVAGTYGTQEGLYVPANELFELAFSGNWSDAHTDWAQALAETKAIAINTLENQGNIWIAEAGQSDFSADLVKALAAEFVDRDLSSRIHIVQHSDWNEKVTSEAALAYVKDNIAYHKIADGNAANNGTPCFKNGEFAIDLEKIKNAESKAIWKLATEISTDYNGKEGRYENDAVSHGGLDFSDLSEVCWLLGREKIEDVDEFFRLFVY